MLQTLRDSWPIIVTIVGAAWYLSTRLTRLEERMATKDDLHSLDVRVARIEVRMGLDNDGKHSTPSPAE